VHVENRVPLVIRHLLDHAVPGVARVVDNDVEAAELVDRGGDEALPEVGVGDAPDARDRLAARSENIGGGLPGRFFVEVVDHDARSLAREFQRYFSPDSPA